MQNINNFRNFKVCDSKYGKLLINPNDIYIGRTILYNQTWEPHVEKKLTEFVKTGMKVIDIGANIGIHTLQLSKLVGETGLVYAFEPNEINRDILFLNMYQNKCFNTTIFQKGCGDENKVLFMERRWLKLDREDNYGAIMLREIPLKQDDVKIDVITIDSLNIDVDLVKIDAEHMEEQVIHGMIKTIMKCKPIIIVEIHINEYRRMKEIFDSLNYTLSHFGNVDNVDYLAIPN